LLQQWAAAQRQSSGHSAAWNAAGLCWKYRSTSKTSRTDGDSGAACLQQTKGVAMERGKDGVLRNRLVLTRMDGEAIQIGDVIVRLKLPEGVKSRVTIEAPPKTVIVREELLERSAAQGNETI
jgi:sRNA-binding carbon storage regulator CsrA